MHCAAGHQGEGLRDMSMGEDAPEPPASGAHGSTLEDRLRQGERDLASANRRAAEADQGRERAETSSWQSVQLLHLLIQSVRDYAIFMLDRNGRVSTWNAGAERIKGYSAQEIIGSPYARFYCPEDAAAGEPDRALATAIREGKYEKEGWRVRKDGRRFWAHVLLQAIRDETGELVGFAKVTRDITDRRQAQIELQTAREALFQAQKMEAVGQLTAGIAHDFNNMLAGIIGALDLLRTRLRTGRHADAERYADMAIAAAERAAALTARLLAFGRRQPLDIKPVDVNAAIASLQELLGRTMGEAIAIALRLAPDLPLAESDVHQLENAILNLAINARDAMPDGGTLTISTGLTDQAPASWNGSGEGPFVTLEVADTGHGMSAEVMAKALEPFFTTKPSGQGTGLGLSMVYGFAKQSRGHLLLESAPGEGTRVRLYLPRSRVSPAEMANASSPPMVQRLGNQVVLVVEDDAAVRMLALEVLSELGIRTQAAEDAASALRLIESGTRIDLILSDIGLTGRMNGRQLADAARVLRPELPILFMTGYAADATRAGFLGPGMDLIQKPFTVATLSTRIRALLKPAGSTDTL